MRARGLAPPVLVDTYQTRNGEAKMAVKFGLGFARELLSGDETALRALIAALTEYRSEVDAYALESKRAYASTVDPNGCLHPDRAIVRETDGRMHCLACERDLPLPETEEVA